VNPLERGLDARVRDVFHADGESPVERQARLHEHGQLPHRVHDRLPRPAIQARDALGSRAAGGGDRLDGRQALAAKRDDHLLAGVALDSPRADHAGGRCRAITESGHRQASRVTRRTSSTVVSPARAFTSPSSSMVRRAAAA
jgi:hypothetical protein